MQETEEKFFKEPSLGTRKVRKKKAKQVVGMQITTQSPGERDAV